MCIPCGPGALALLGSDRDLSHLHLPRDVTPSSPGASQHALASETSAEVARKLLELNSIGPIALTRAALPHMLSRKK